MSRDVSKIFLAKTVFKGISDFFSLKKVSRSTPNNFVRGDWPTPSPQLYGTPLIPGIDIRAADALSRF